ncbi:hypothetical protein ABK040_012704 [Willaertia magna]
MSSLIPKDELTRIAEFIGTIKEFMFLAMTCRSCFEDLVLSNNYSLNEIFKRSATASINIPDYIKSKLYHLNIRHEPDDISFNICFNSFENLQELSLSFINTYRYRCYDPQKYLFLNLNGLPNLKYLKKLSIVNGSERSISNNESLENSLQKLDNLTFLHLENVKIQEQYLQQLINLESLTLLNCSGVRDVNFLQNFKQLKSLTTDIPMWKFDSLPTSIESATLHSYESEGDILNTLVNLKNLKLHLKDFKGNCLENLNKLKTLKISCHNSNLPLEQIRYENFKYLNNLKTLKTLELTNVHKISDKDLNMLTNLKALKLMNCKNMVGTCLLNFKKLRVLITDIPYLNEYLKECINLEYFELTNYSGDFLLNMINIKYLYKGDKLIEERQSSFVNYKFTTNALTSFPPLIGTSNKCKNIYLNK